MSWLSFRKIWKKNNINMDKNLFDIDKSSLTTTKTVISNNYTHHIVNYKNVAMDNMILTGNYIGILPFEIDKATGNISYVFLSKAHNFFKDEIKKSLIIEKFDDEHDNSPLDVVYRYFEKNLAVPLRDEKLEKIFYIGEIEMNNFLDGRIPCYAINVTGMITEKENVFKISDDFPHVIERIDYNNMLKGATHDFLAISATFLLLSYLT